jgi:predicted GIY-YIG superfamily endonuclease
MAAKRRRKASSSVEQWVVSHVLTKWWFWLWAAFTYVTYRFFGDMWSVLKVEAAIVGVSTCVFVSLWRRERLRLLAAKGLPNPGLLGVVKDAGKVAVAIPRTREGWVNAWASLPALKGRKMPPLRNMTMTADGDLETLVHASKYGVTVELIQANAADIAQICNSPRLVVRRTSIGWAKLTFRFTEPLERVLPIAELPLPKTRGNIVIGVTEDGDPMELPGDQCILDGGVQGSGKSNDLWCLLASLNMQGIPTRARFIDLKDGMELSRLGANPLGEWVGLGNLCVAGYTTDADEGLQIVQDALDDMRERAKRLGEDKVRKFREYTQDDPFLLLVIDEALDYNDEFKKGTSRPLGQFNRKVRAVGGLTMATVQYAHAQDMGVGRKPFGTRICHRAEKETGDTILGAGAASRGAEVDKIPQSMPGVGFYVDPDRGEQTPFRSAYVTDADADRIASGLLPEGIEFGTPAEEIAPECAVYWLRSSDGESLYIGKALDPAARWDQHKSPSSSDYKPWIDEVDWTQTKVFWKDNEAAALKYEKHLTEKFGSKYNDLNNRKTPWRVDWRAEHKAKKAAEAADAVPEPSNEELAGRRPLQLVVNDDVDDDGLMPTGTDSYYGSE